VAAASPGITIGSRSTKAEIKESAAKDGRPVEESMLAKLPSGAMDSDL